MVPLGILQATCAVVGNSIGANRVDLAWSFFWLILQMSIAVYSVISVTLIYVRMPLVDLLTQDEEVRSITSPVFLFITFSFFCDGNASETSHEL